MEKKNTNNTLKSTSASRAFFQYKSPGYQGCVSCSPGHHHRWKSAPNVCPASLQIRSQGFHGLPSPCAEHRTRSYQARWIAVSSRTLNFPGNLISWSRSPAKKQTNLHVLQSRAHFVLGSHEMEPGRRGSHPRTCCHQSHLGPWSQRLAKRRLLSLLPQRMAPGRGDPRLYWQEIQLHVSEALSKSSSGEPARSRLSSLGRALGFPASGLRFVILGEPTRRPQSAFSQ